MRITRNVGAILLAVYLIIAGLVSLVGLSFTGLWIVLGILAIAAGVALLTRIGRIRRAIGVALLAVWLIVSGLIAIVDLSFTGLGIVLGILALAAGIALLVWEGLPGRVGVVLLAIRLIIAGLVQLVGLSFAGLGIAQAVLAIAAGVLILISV